METFKEQKPQRSTIGKFFKYTFIGFNILMFIWLIGGVGSASQSISNTSSEAEQAGAAIGTGIGAIFIIFLWVAGDVILGILTYFTKAKK